MHYYAVVRPGLSGTVCDDGENADIDRSSAVSEVYQAQQTEDDQFASQGQPEYVLLLTCSNKMEGE